MAVFRYYSCARAYFSRARSGSVYESSRSSTATPELRLPARGAPLNSGSVQGCESLLFALPSWQAQERALDAKRTCKRRVSLKQMRFAIVLLFAATAHALRPVPLMVQRRALLGGGAAAFVRERCRNVAAPGRCRRGPD